MFWNGLGLVICGLVVVLILRETRRELVPYILLTLCILVWLSILPAVSDSVAWLRTLTEEGKFGMVLLKALGISLLTEVGCEICRSAGEAGLVGYVALVGKGELLVLALPLLQEFTSLIVGFAL